MQYKKKYCQARQILLITFQIYEELIMIYAKNRKQKQLIEFYPGLTSTS